MDWVKIYNKHLFGLKKLEKAALVEIQLLTAFLERIPSENEMIQATSKHQLTTLRQVLEGRSTTLRQVLDKVLEDVQDIADKRSSGKARKEIWRNKHKNINTEREAETKGNEADKIRGDKRREDITKNVTAALFSFNEIWDLYPNKDGRKRAESSFNNTVKTDQDFSDIKKALKNYLSSEKVKKGYIKNGSTWFNNWKDWINYIDPVAISPYKKYEPKDDGEESTPMPEEAKQALANFKMKGV